MSDFTTARPADEPLDPHKRVHYTFGLVLGKDEFVQEQTYFLEKHRLHNRALHGYGTVCGLHLGDRGSGAAYEVTVSAGLAVNPQGETIRVPANQCARINAWLARHADEVTQRLGSPPGPGPLTLYVVLCSNECLTDQVPIPGGPCRSQQESMAASRIADHFQLKLSWTPPPQVEEESVRQFGELLRTIEIGGPGPFLTREQLESLVRGLPGQLSSPPGSPPAFGSPPGGPWSLDPVVASELLRAAFRVWVTEVRPTLLGGDVNCAGGPPAETCVLLGEVRFEVAQDPNGDFLADEASVEFDEGRRPVLLHTRLLQEWLLCGRPSLNARAARSFATLFAAGGSVVRAWLHHPDLLDVPDSAVTAELDGVALNPTVSRPDAAANVFDLDLATPLSNENRIEIVFDALQVTESPAPGRSLAEMLENADFGYLDRLGDRLHAHVIAHLPGLGDLADVSAPAPADGQALTWNQAAAVWAPADVAAGPGDHGALSGRGDDDHPQYLLADGSRALSGDLSAGGNRITRLGAATANGDAVRFQQAVKVGDPAGGDLAGTYPNPRLRREFVAAPGGPYAIVGAGFFQPDGAPIGPVYNNLRVRRINPPGTFLLNFRGYRRPDDTFMFIVKGTPGDTRQGLPVRATFQFVEFQAQGVLVRVLATNNEPTELPFMVEISRIGAP